ncbi:MAG TPA: S-adenosylmethionine:tRNA ribosyltransferase-isomerase, partial [Acidimicrobiales bacterium]|nr:S-adenosylmethionine:tRNA ribosyltransferase-isomerase [Acidimicrobiales bacterium]
MTALLSPLEVLDFELPEALEASEPPEARGADRDDARLLVAWRRDERIAHSRFADLPRYLEAGDLLVVNTSATIAAAVDATGADGTPLEVHVSTTLPGGLWVVELRRPGQPASLPWPDGRIGSTVLLPGGASAELLAPFGTPGRLWIASLRLREPLAAWLARYGRPIRYRHVHEDWPLAHYQTVFATEPG